jgi:transcriptional regulator with XRE-family HTH domain
MDTEILELRESIGRTAREARLRAGLTQDEVASSMGITPEVYGRLERAQMLPSVPSLLRLCHTLGLSANALLGLDVGARPKRPPGRPAFAWVEESPGVRRLMQRIQSLDEPAREALLHVASVMRAQNVARRRSGKS